MSNTWSKIKPTVGEWYLSIAPDKRDGSPIPICPVCKCQVDRLDGPPNYLYVLVDRAWIPLENELFSGAMWQRIEAPPIDPFIENCEKFLDFGVE